MAFPLLSPLILVVAVVGLIVYRTVSSSPLKQKLKLPPGPRPLPLLGNINDLPPPGVVEHEHWFKHKDLYGPISSVTVMGKTLIIIHDAKIAHDLLELSSVKTSGRPTSVFANQMCGYGNVIPSQGYTSTFRYMRKLLHRELGTRTLSDRFQHLQEAEVNYQLVRTLNQPEKALEHYKK
jgi:hypothetical protein